MQRGTRFIIHTCAVLALVGSAHAQSRLSGLRDTSIPLVPNAPLGAALFNPTASSGINSQPQQPTATVQAGTGGGTGPVVATPATGNTVNNVEFRTTSGGTFIPGYGPAGGVVYGPGVGAEAPRQQAISPPAPDLSLEQKITHLEALDGLTYADTVQVQNTIRRFQLVDAAKVLAEPERRLLRGKLVDSPVATGVQNILSRFLRDAELIQSHHVVVGVVPRKNLILIGLRSSEEG